MQYPDHKLGYKEQHRLGGSRRSEVETAGMEYQALYATPGRLEPWTERCDRLLRDLGEMS